MDVAQATDALAGDAVPGAARQVLVVDDSQAQRKLLTASLHRLGYAVREARTGEEALEVCRCEAVDIVLSDWMMPGMDGLSFCRAFRALDRSSYGYFILLTSKSDKGEIALGLDAGADDFLTKPVHSDELRARLAAGDRILTMERQLSEKNRIVNATLAELNEFYASLNRDLEQARVLQESLIPERHRMFGRSSVALFTQPCGDVGGDLVGMFAPDEDRLGIYAIDVCGHGVSSAMMTARLHGHLSGRSNDQNLALEEGADRYFALRPPAEVARLLNMQLLSDMDVEQYFTMVYGAIDLASGKARLVQAGHPHPLVLRADGRTESLGAGGPPVGLLREAAFEEVEVQLGPGDRLLLYSDGFSESADADGTMLEEGGMVSLLSARRAETGPALLEGLFRDVLARRPPGCGFDDDVSAALLEYQPPGGA